jgi:hypothetical protein
MPETYKVVGTNIGTTAATNIYLGVTSVTGGYALVNSINVANGSTGLANIFSVELLKGGSTAFFVINNATLPTGASIQILDNTLVLERNDNLRCTAGYTFGVHVLVSSLEIT